MMICNSIIIELEEFELVVMHQIKCIPCHRPQGGVIMPSIMTSDCGGDKSTSVCRVRRRLVVKSVAAEASGSYLDRTQA